MTYQQKNSIASLVVSILTVIIYIISVLYMLLNDSFTESNVFWLWGAIIIITIVGVIITTIMAHIFSGIVEAVQTREEPEIDSIEDERDQLIDLKGKKTAYNIFSLGIFLAMILFLFNRDGLVLFSLLIPIGIAAQIAGDLTRLCNYRRGF